MWWFWELRGVGSTLLRCPSGWWQGARTTMHSSADGLGQGTSMGRRMRGFMPLGGRGEEGGREHWRVLFFDGLKAGNPKI